MSRISLLWLIAGLTIGLVVVSQILIGPPSNVLAQSSTPTPTATNTPILVPPPPTPANPATPIPLPYYVSSHSSQNNCADIGIEGVVTGPDSLPLGNVTLQFGEVGVQNSRFLATTDYNGRYSGLLLSGSDRVQVERSHDWYVYVLNDKQPVSPVFEFTTDPMFADNPPRCGDNSDGSQPGCIMDPCRHRNAIQVKIINWKKIY